MPSYTSDKLIERIKTWGSIPTSQPLFNTAAFLRILNDEMVDTIVPLMMSMREEYFVQAYDVAVDTTVSNYRVPERAAGGVLRDVLMVDSTDDVFSIPRIEPENRQYYGSGFYMEGNNVVLIEPSNYSGLTLRMTYLERRNQIADTADCGQITNINTGTNEITVAAVPGDWTTSTTLDMIMNRSPFDTLARDITISSIVTNVITVSSIPTGLAVGDWLSEAQTSPIAQIPVEAQNLLCQAALIKCLEAMGDVKGVASAAQKYGEMKMNMKILLSPRVEGEVKKVVGTNRLLFRGGPLHYNY